MSSGPHTYRGHRATSFVASDINELVELRARQRTFHGAYSRTALGNLGYSLAILRLFDRRFYKIGLLYAVLAAALFILSYFRSQHSKHDFADVMDSPKYEMRRHIRQIDDEQTRRRQGTLPLTALALARRTTIIQTPGQCGPGKRVYGRPFVTAGSIVVALAVVVAAMEVSLLVLILRVPSHL